MKTTLFDFELPPERIATEPVTPRDASRMLVVEGGNLRDDFTRNLAGFLRAGDVVVMNDTKVIPARLRGMRGLAKVEITLLKNKGGRVWTAFAKPAKRLRIGDNVTFSENLSAEVQHKHESGEVEISFIGNRVNDEIKLIGEMPLPPYMKRHSEDADKRSYQTIYAQKEGAVAAPTAGLHFTDSLLKSIEEAGAKMVRVTLHVGAGTFQPVKADDTDGHIMHSEYAELSAENADMLNECRKNGGRIIAVGTTSLRVLESAADDAGMLHVYNAETAIFITPGYVFKAVDVLLTNFHLPRSTLFMLVSAFSGLDTMKRAYKHAMEAHYRFYSYGDACLLFKDTN